VASLPGSFCASASWRFFYKSGSAKWFATFHSAGSKRQLCVSSWEDSPYSFHLVRTSFTDRCGLVIYSERVNSDAEFAMIEAARVEKQDAPAREAERQKKQTDDRDLARQKNQKSFRP